MSERIGIKTETRGGQETVMTIEQLCTKIAKSTEPVVVQIKEGTRWHDSTVYGPKLKEQNERSLKPVLVMDVRTKTLQMKCGIPNEGGTIEDYTSIENEKTGTSDETSGSFSFRNEVTGIPVEIQFKFVPES